MAKRKIIGIFFREALAGWTGGLYYNLNLIQALNHLPDALKPLLVIFANEQFYKQVQQTAYPYLKKSTDIEELNVGPRYTLFERIINKMGSIVLKKQLIDNRLSTRDIQFIFPLESLNSELYHKNPFHSRYYLARIPKIYWIPDFQEHYLPQFFSEQDIAGRKAIQRKMAAENITIVFSSADARKDFYRFYPDAKAKSKLLHFSVTHPDYSHVDGSLLKQKYNLDKPYFFSPNQFWAHKNHIVVIEAARLLKEKGKHTFMIAFSGKENDYRNPEYLSSIKNKVSTYRLENHIKFLGFLDRPEQLKLMSLAIAIIQPSLFEGWSTVVEDAKAMDQFVIASDLQVHQEQAIQNALFFNPYDAQELADKMEILLGNPPQKIQTDYKQNITTFAREFIDIM